MIFKEQFKVRSFKKYWKKQGRKDLFTWVHRYLRLHSELLTDSVYQNMYNYHRDTLIEYLKNDIGKTKMDNTQLGELVDVLADIYNKTSAEQVNKCKSLVEELYEFWKEKSKE